MNRISRGVVVVVLLLHAAPGDAQVQNQPPSARFPRIAAPSGIIRGMVVEESSGRPLAAVQVTLHPESSAPAVILTDASGGFAFQYLWPDRYTLSFAKAGFVTLALGQHSPLDEPTVIELRDRQTVDKLAMSLSIGGAIEGRVLDDAGWPVVEANVTALRYQWFLGQRRLMPTEYLAITDDRGHYRLWGLSPGEYVVSAVIGATKPDPNGEPQAVADTNMGYAATYYPAVDDVAGALRVSVKAGTDATGIDITFHATRLVRVSGRVGSSSGRVDPSVRLVLMRARANNAPVPVTSPGTPQVSTQGVFSIVGVPPGQYVLQAHLVPRTAPPGSGGVAVTSEFATVPVTVTNGNVGGLAVTTAPTGRLSVQLFLDGVLQRSTATTPVTLVAAPVAPEQSAPTAETALARSGNAFEVVGVAGRFLLRPRDLPAGVSLESITQAGVDVTDVGVDVFPGQSVSDVVVRLTSKPTRLTGRVLTEDGSSPVPGSTVVVFALDRERWELPYTRFVASATADRDGRFQIEGLPTGTYQAAAFGQLEHDIWRNPDFLELASKSAVRVTIRDGAESTTDLKRQ